MLPRLSPMSLLIVAVTLDVAGGLLIVFSLPDGGGRLWFGVGLLAIGSLLMRTGINRMNQEVERHSGESTDDDATQGEIEPELKKLTPRSVELSQRGKTVAAVWALLIAVTGAAVWHHFNRLQPPLARSILDSEGESATATIHEKATREIEGRGTTYTVRYNFSDETGTAVRSSATVPRAVYDTLAEGQELEVVYFSPDPSVHYLPGITSPVSTRMVWLAIAILVAPAGFADAQRRSHRALVSEGRAVAGFVADVRRRGGVRSFFVNYGADGERRTIKASERNPNIRNGQNATVLYDAKRPDRAVVYRLALYHAKG